MRKIKTVLVDDSEEFRSALTMYLSEFQEFDIIAEYPNGRDFLGNLNKLLPDLVFMDIEMPVLNGVEATREAIRRFGRLQIVALTFHSEFQHTYDILLAGANQYLIKNKLRREDILRIIERLNNIENIKF